MADSIVVCRIASVGSKKMEHDGRRRADPLVVPAEFSFLRGTCFCLLLQCVKEASKFYQNVEDSYRD